MSEHHPSCAITRQGDIRAFCDCKWPEIRNEERDKILRVLTDHSTAWHDLAKFKGNSSMAGRRSLARHTAIQDLINMISHNSHRTDHYEDS